MMTAMAMSTLMIVGFVQLIYGAMAPTPGRLQGNAIALNMIIVARFAPVLAEIAPGVVVNYTAVSYAVVMCAMTIILERYGRAAFRHAIMMTYAVISFSYAIGFAFTLVPPIAGNEQFANAAALLGHHSLPTMAASFAAFACSMHYGVLAVWQRFRGQLGVCPTALLAAIAGQAIDSMIFYPISFWTLMDGREIAEAAIIGFLFKAALAVVFLPVTVIATRLVPSPQPRTI